MPFPLAHPVAVLPLRRWCPQWFSFLGLVVGSVTPDAGYLLRTLDFQQFSHSLVGSVAFCLPAGLIAVLVIQALRRALVTTLPSPHRQALETICGVAAGCEWRKLALSVLIGAWTHIAFDGLTHESALHARQAETWRTTISTVEESGLKFYQVLWVCVSTACLAVLVAVYLRFLKRTTGQCRLFDPADGRRVVLWGGLLILPFLAIAPVTFHAFEPSGIIIDKHTLYRTLQPYLLLVSLEVLLLGLVQRWRLQRFAKSTPPSSPEAKESSNTPVRPE